MSNINLNNSNELPIIRKLTDLYKLFYRYRELFPKKDKYTLGNTCEQYIISTLEYLLAAGNASKIEKKPLIQQANLKFDALKFFIRISHELKLLDDKKYLALQTIIQEIGRMLGGWQKSLF